MNIYCGTFGFAIKEETSLQVTYIFTWNDINI